MLVCSSVFSISKSAIVTLLLLCTLQMAAQQYSFRHITVADGLSNSSINQIFQDSEGYIWMATQGGGVCKYNGAEFTTYNKANGLPSNDITCITEHRGNIWVGTATGAALLQDERFVVYDEDKGITNNIVYCIYPTADGKVWFATEDDGFKILDENKITSVNTSTGLSTNYTNTIAQNNKGSIWLGTANGIAKYEQGKVTDYSKHPAVNGEDFFCSSTDALGNIWMGSTAGKVIIISPTDSISALKLPDVVANDYIGSIAHDAKGNTWLATDHGLLKHSPTSGFFLFTENQGLSVNMVQAVMADYEGSIWAGTLLGGINVLHSEAFVRYTDKQKLASQNITALLSDTDHQLYLGTAQGLFVRNGNGLSKVSDLLYSSSITSLAIDKYHHLWVTAQDGIHVLKNQGGRWRYLRNISQAEGVDIVSPQKIVCDDSGTCWVATFGSGLIRITAGSTQKFNTENGFVTDKLLTIHIDKKNNIWLGTLGAGVIRYNGTVFQQYTTMDGLPDMSIWAITDGADGSVFLGTAEGGICVFDGKRFSTIATAPQLSDNFVSTLLYDEHSRCLWAGTDKGLERVSIGRKGEVQVKNYNAHGGFSPVSINPGALLLDGTNFIWIGTTNGWWQYDKTNDAVKQTPPKLQLTGLRLFFGKEKIMPYCSTWPLLSDGQSLNLPHNKNHLTFDIRAMTTSSVKYRFWLKGLDESWSEPTTSNTITYSNIPPGGTYTFQAVAILPSGTQSNPLNFTFTVNTPWFKTWWFLLLCVGLVIIGLYLFIKTRERILLQQNRQLEKTVALRTAEIEQQKILVEKSLSEKEVLLKEIHHRVKNNLQMISSLLMLQGASLTNDQAKKAIQESQSRVRSIALVHQKLYQTDGLEKVEFSAFVAELSQQIQSLFQNRAQRIEIQISIPETHLLMDKAIPLGLMLNELLTNSYKYAFDGKETGYIHIRLQPEAANKVLLIYSDNGPGINNPDIFQKPSSLGLRMVKLLASQIGAEIEYIPSAAAEFQIRFSVGSLPIDA